MPTDNFQEKDNNIFDSKPPQRPNPMKRLQKIRETFMGFMYILVAIALIWAEKNEYTTFGLQFSYGLAAVFIIYGLFRLYRALIRKDN